MRTITGRRAIATTVALALVLFAAAPSSAAEDSAWFQTTILPTAGVPWAVVSGDLTGDGVPDVAANSASDDLVIVFEGDGAGSLTDVGRYHVGPTPATVVAADIDLDGDLDLLAPDGTGSISILLGAGDGSFSAGTPVAVGSEAGDVAVGDIDPDGIPDLVVATPFRPSFTVLRGDGAAGFEPLAIVPIGSRGTSRVALSDLDGDGTLDVVVGTVEVEAGTSEVIATFLGNGSGGLVHAASVSAVGRTAVLDVADLDGDGSPDVVAGGLSGLVVHLGDGAGGLGSRTASVDVAAYGIAAADFDGDGRLDVACTDAETDEIVVLGGDGRGGFMGFAIIATDLPNPYGLTATDLDMDGHGDLVTAIAGDQGQGAIGVLRNTGQAVPYQPFPVPSPTGQPALPPTATIETAQHDPARPSAAMVTVGLVGLTIGLLVAVRLPIRRRR
jgi:hypothetical protein